MLRPSDLSGGRLSDATVVTSHRWRNSQRNRSRLLWAIAILIPILGVLLFFQLSAHGQQEQLVRERQIKTLARALAYDENLTSRAGSTVVLAVLYKPGNPAAEKEATEWFALFAKLESYRIRGLPFHSVMVRFTNAEALDKAVGEQGVDALYVCPGMEGEIAAIKRVSQKHKTITIGSREELVTAGLALGVFSVNGKLAVVVNLPASREEGAQFGSDLLRLAKVIQ